MVVKAILLVLAVTGWLCAVWFYVHLWRWHRDCNSATIAVAYKGKVVMSPTLVELLLWSRKVPKEQSGQVFYKTAHVTIAIIKSARRTVRRTLITLITRRIGRGKP